MRYSEKALSIGVLDLGKQFQDINPAERVSITLQLARAAELAGAKRYWVAEHHVPDAALHAPEIVLALIGAATEHLMIGSAGVLMHYYSPLKVWETYCTLEAAFPKRIELGVCKGPGVQHEEVGLQLKNGDVQALTNESFESKVLQLFHIAQHGTGLRQLRLIDNCKPRIWILGSGSRSVALANNTNSGYGYMCFYPGGLKICHDVLRDLKTKEKILAISVIAADTDEEATLINKECTLKGLLSANVIGSITECVAQLQCIARNANTNEVVIACLSPLYQHHKRLLDIISYNTSQEAMSSQRAILRQ